MKSFAASDWDEEFRAVFVRRESPPACPTCHRSGFYGPRKAGDRSYRMCKFCGLYQAPGQKAVQLIPTAHGCVSWPQTVGAQYIWWVQPTEQRYDCPACGSEVTVAASTVKRPLDVPGHPWWAVPQAMSFEEARHFWVQHGQPRVYL